MTNSNRAHSMRLGDIDLTASAFVMTLSRDQAILHGLEEPTPLEVEEHNKAAQARWQESRDQWARLDLFAAELARIADPLALKILDLHACADDAAVCDACSLDADDPYDEPWPCVTVRAVADHFGIEIPSGYFGERPGERPHEMPAEGYQPFRPPLARWSSALGESFDSAVLHGEGED